MIDAAQHPGSGGVQARQQCRARYPGQREHRRPGRIAQPAAKNQEAHEVAVARKEGRQPNVYHGLFSTHPDNDARFREVVSAAKKYKTGSTTRVGRDSFLLRLDGMTFGNSGREGIIRNNRFYHKDLNFTLAFPGGWLIDNGTERIIATPKAKDGLLQMSMANLDRPFLNNCGRILRAHCIEPLAHRNC